MAFDGIVTKTIINELNNNIIGARVEKIFTPTKENVVLCLYNNGKNYALNICTNPNNCRMHLTTHKKENPKVAPNFCMLLRKHLTGNRIINITSYDLERIIIFTFEKYNNFNTKIKKKLVVEIMGHFSNVILLNENDNILDCLKHFELPRSLMPTQKYVMPSNGKKQFINTTLNEFINLVPLNSSIDTELSNLFIGISKSFIQNLCELLNINLEKYSKYDLEKLYNSIYNIITNLNNNVCLFSKDKSDYFINSGSPENLQVNFFIDDFYYEKEKKETFINTRNNILKNVLAELKKYNKRLENINLKLDECKKMDKYKLYGELLTANLYKFSKNETQANVLNYYTGEFITIPLDNKISPSKNAENFYKKYNKLKNTLNIVTKQKKETMLELEYIESLIYSINEANSLETLEEINEEIIDSFNLHYKNSSPNKNKIQKNQPIKYNINGFEVFAGKNNIQNDLLTKSAKKTDLWFHTKQIHGSHVILKTDGKVPDSDTIQKCAKIAAKSSKAKHSSNIPVDYCLVKYVKKPSGAKPRNGYIY